jgi:transposase InsO family protein
MMVHSAPLTTNASAPTVAKVFFDTMFRLHGLPQVIVSDRDTRFTSQFWKALFSHLGTKLVMSTAFHPQTDGQTERANRTLEDMLRAYTNYQQDDWDQHLTAAEFACNSAPNVSTKLPPFQPVYGHSPCTPSSSFLPREDHVPAAADFLTLMDNLTHSATDALVMAKARQEEYANQSRREQTFVVGDRVLVSTANFHARIASPSSIQETARWLRRTLLYYRSGFTCRLPTRSSILLPRAPSLSHVTFATIPGSSYLSTPAGASHASTRHHHRRGPRRVRSGTYSRPPYPSPTQRISCETDRLSGLFPTLLTLPNWSPSSIKLILLGKATSRTPRSWGGDNVTFFIFP